MEKMTVLRIEPSLHVRLKIIAFKQRRSLYDLTTEIIKEWLALAESVIAAKERTERDITTGR